MWFGSRNRPYANAESAFFKSIKRSVLRRQCSLDTNRNLKRLVYNEFYESLNISFSDEEPSLETLDLARFTYICSTPTFYINVVCCVGRVEIQIEI